MHGQVCLSNLACPGACTAHRGCVGMQSSRMLPVNIAFWWRDALRIDQERPEFHWTKIVNATKAKISSTGSVFCGFLL